MPNLDPQLGNSSHEHGHTVIHIFVDGKEITTQKTTITVSDLKALAGVPPAYQLEEAKENRLIPLNDDGRVELKDQERFISHPKDGVSS
jgi:hypothetical protein